MAFVIDSSGWIEYFSGGSRARKYEEWVGKASPENCYCPAMVIFEVYRTAKKKLGEEAAVRYATEMMGLATMVPLDEKTAFEAADLSLSSGLAAADAIILATARKTGSTLVTSDSHFKGMAGVEFIP